MSAFACRLDDLGRRSARSHFRIDLDLRRRIGLAVEALPIGLRIDG